jgi:hypothetical protein
LLFINTPCALLSLLHCAEIPNGSISQQRKISIENYNKLLCKYYIEYIWFILGW